MLTALVVAAVGLTVIAGGPAGAKDDKKAKAAVDSARKFAELEARVDADTIEYAGTVDGTDAYIAVVVNGKDVRVYVCDGAALTAWALGKVAKDGTFAVEAANGTKVAGTISESATSGTVTVADGSDHAFTAPLATSPAGLYERIPAKDASGQVLVSATIVLADGTQRGAAKPSLKTICTNIKASWTDYVVNAALDPSPNGAVNQAANYRAHGCSAVTGDLWSGLL